MADRHLPFPANSRRGDDHAAGATERDALDPSMLSYLARMDGAWSSALSSSADNESPADSTGPEFGVPCGKIGRYEVYGELGGGTFGVVLHAFDPRIGQYRALKLPRLETLASPQARSRFLDEPKTLGLLDHRNIVRVYDADQVGPLCYMVMEYCEGGSLGSWLKTRPPSQKIPPRWAAELVAQVADGVSHAHERNIYHRDLKPGNILLVPIPSEGEDPPRFLAKVGDFGMAKLLDASDDAMRDRTATGMMLGTLAYMAPEQARGDKAALGPGADVYALGVILYELLARRLPFPSGLPKFELLEHVLNVEPASPRTHRPDLPRDLVTICRKCLSKLPSDRYRSSAALAEDLRRFLQGLPILGRLAPPWRSIGPTMRRHPVKVVLGTMALTSGILGGAALEVKARQDAQVWLSRLEGAPIRELEELISDRQPGDRRVAAGLEKMFRAGRPSARTAAAIALASAKASYADYAYEQILNATPEDLSSLAMAAKDRIPELLDRLEIDVEAVPEPFPDRREVRDRRRANAASALIVLGRAEPGWQLLDFDPGSRQADAGDPQARAFLIDRLAATGITPSAIFDRLKDEPKAPIRRALILALGNVPRASWDEVLQDRVLKHVLALYQNDPDAGVHSAAKWLLKTRGRDADLKEANALLSGKSRGENGFPWRISRLGLTLIAVGDIEMADTETTARLYRGFRPDHDFDRDAKDGLDAPVRSVNFNDAAEFCNWLTLQEGYDESDLVYRKGKAVRWELNPDHPHAQGFRLPTDREHETACRAGTTSMRYWGDTLDIIDKYELFDVEQAIHPQPVGLLKPNDFGFFDMLGNVAEVCRMTRQISSPINQAMVRGGSFLSNGNFVTSTTASPPMAADQEDLLYPFGFRVARTLRAGGNP